jgi:hypothetical protein
LILGSGPSRGCSLFGDFCAPLFAELRGPLRAANQAAFASKLLRGIARIVLDFAGCDLHDAHGVADHVCWALLASRSPWHASRIARLDQDAKRDRFQTETLPKGSFVPSEIIFWIALRLAGEPEVGFGRPDAYTKR